ncbi:PI-PLC X domain-containing protein At5g67130 [Elaeis guineensis]|uniref:PI-PLC X domain-containing protein At5g67130 isoform X2 n=1 Tax=Elaeis guineensis var. tenera TaxID=51953 RepID=A0A6I9S2D7_ELAGV|nr:PI-PLC X domain-containing protein At5g67130 isoform X2 [Elaeis guineensis]
MKTMGFSFSGLPLFLCLPFIFLLKAMRQSHFCQMDPLKILLVVVCLAFLSVSTACSNGNCRLLDECSSDGDCESGLYCFSCPLGFLGSRCVRSTISDQFKLVNNSLPFNKYAYLTTHNSYAIEGEPSHTGVPRVTFDNQEDSVTQQLNNGVRALMLDTYDFDDDVWLCHSNGGKCNDFTAFEPAIDTMKEIEAFLSANPSEIVTLILEDYVKAPNGLTKVFNDSGLLKYWFPVSRMPQIGQDWPLVSNMVASNQRLIVFTSVESKQESEGIAYQWNFMVENQYGDGGMKAGNCFNRAESAPLNDMSKSLVLVNYFPSIPVKLTACVQNSADLIGMLNTCYNAAANRWANFVAVDYYKRSEGGGAFQATDMLNGRLLCGCDDVHACAPGSTSGACTPP